jgi:hypothetical protein
MDPLMKLFGRPNLIAEFFAEGEREESLLKYIKPCSALRVKFDDKLRPQLICKDARQARLLEDVIDICLHAVRLAVDLTVIIDAPGVDAGEKRKAARDLRHLQVDVSPYWPIFTAWTKFQAEGAKFRSELIALRDSVDDANFYCDLELTAQRVESGH